VALLLMLAIIVSVCKSFIGRTFAYLPTYLGR